VTLTTPPARAVARSCEGILAEQYRGQNQQG
jgi:hypothetical protein